MNRQAIEKRIRDDARTISTWSIMRGFRPPTVYMLLSGKLRPTTPMCSRIIEALKRDGYLKDEDLAA